MVTMIATMGLDLRRTSRYRAPNVADSIRMAHRATACSPPSTLSLAKKTSLSHSHANHGAPGLVKEKMSRAGTHPWAIIHSPVRMCQPVSQSPSLFSAALVRTPRARVLIIDLSAVLALAMNFIRSLVLTLLVNGGVHVEGAWHDLTGYSILAFTAALLVCVAVALERATPAQGPAAETGPAPPGVEGPRRFHGPQAVLTCVLALAAASLGFFAANTHPPVGKDSSSPDLLAVLPPSAAGWSVQTTPGLDRFVGILRTDHLAQRTYVRGAAGGEDQVALFLAHWSRGQASVGLVESHTPDACWPGSGWVAQ